MKKPFDKEAAIAYLEVLHKMVNPPPSDRMMDPILVDKIRTFLANSEEKTTVHVWNIYKELLDMSVHVSLASGFFVTLLDLEHYLEAPEGGFSEDTGSINQAPWRQGSV